MSGWMDQELFQNWLENRFIPEVKWAGIPKPILLLIDGAKCHILLFISKLCDQENIILYTLLPNVTHLIQPLNLVLMGSVKSVYKEEVQTWHKENLGDVYNKEAFIGVFTKLWKKCSNVENAVNGFCKAGIFPWNPSAVEGKKLAPALLYQNIKDNLPEVGDTGFNLSVDENLAPVSASQTMTDDNVIKEDSMNEKMNNNHSILGLTENKAQVSPAERPK